MTSEDPGIDWKDANGFDLPIALGLLWGSGQVKGKEKPLRASSGVGTAYRFGTKIGASYLVQNWHSFSYRKLLSYNDFGVGDRGLEPLTSCVSSRHSNQLS